MSLFCGQAWSEVSGKGLLCKAVDGSLGISSLLLASQIDFTIHSKHVLSKRAFPSMLGSLLRREFLLLLGIHTDMIPAI